MSRHVKSRPSGDVHLTFRMAWPLTDARLAWLSHIVKRWFAAGKLSPDGRKLDIEVPERHARDVQRLIAENVRLLTFADMAEPIRRTGGPG